MDDMANTIIAGAQVRINNKATITVNSIIAFKKPNSNQINLLRVIGLPGDEIDINGGKIYRNNKLVKQPPLAKKIYTIYFRDPSMFSKLENYVSRPYSEHYSMFSLSDVDRKEILALNIVDSLYLLGIDSSFQESGVLQSNTFKYSNNYYFGPIKIPFKNSVIDNYILSVTPLYLSKNDLGSKIEDDYFFCLGDNYPQAKDSRFIGLIPRSHIIGIVDKFDQIKPVFVKLNK